MKQNFQLAIRIRKGAENPEKCLCFLNLTFIKRLPEKATRTRREDAELGTFKNGTGRDAPEQ